MEEPLLAWLEPPGAISGEEDGIKWEGAAACADGGDDGLSWTEPAEMQRQVSADCETSREVDSEDDSAGAALVSCFAVEPGASDLLLLPMLAGPGGLDETELAFAAGSEAGATTAVGTAAVVLAAGGTATGRRVRSAESGAAASPSAPRIGRVRRAAAVKAAAAESSRHGKRINEPLPEEALRLLAEWLHSPEHYKWPYPTGVPRGRLCVAGASVSERVRGWCVCAAEQRAALARDAGISERQVMNWLTNARKRVWKVCRVVLSPAHTHPPLCARMAGGNHWKRFPCAAAGPPRAWQDVHLGVCCGGAVTREVGCKAPQDGRLTNII